MNAISNSHLLVSIIISDLFGDGYLKNMSVLGSGITVYNLIWGTVNASFAIDGGSSQSYVHDRSCYDMSPPGCYNISVYNAQSLTFDNHILNIALFSYNDAVSDFIFDYAIVNDTEPVVQSSSSSSTGSNPPPNHVSRYVFPSSLTVDS